MKKSVLLLSLAFVAAAASAQVEIKSPGSEYDAEPPALEADFSVFNNFIALQIAQSDPDIQRLTDDEFVYDAILNEKGKFVKVNTIKGEHKGLSAWGRMRLLQAPRWAPATKDGQPVDIHLLITLHVATVYPVFGNHGGVRTFANYVENKLVYPSDPALQGIEATPVVSFTVLEDGKVDLENVKITDSPDPRITDAIMQVLREAPGWVPGMKKGVAQKFSYDMPIDLVGAVARGAK